MTDTHIKIKPVQPKVQYVGNGSTTVFSYSFAIFDDSDMEVYFGDEQQTTGYTVSGAGQTDGGDVTFSTAPEDGVIVTLVRNVPVERLTDFQEGGTFRAKNINDELDRQTAFVQQVSEQLSRCVQVGITSDVDPSAILPKIERLYDSADNIDALAEDKDNMNAVADDLTNIDAVASDLTNIDIVAGDKLNIDAVAGNKTNIDSVATNETNINTVATNISNVNTVAENISEIEEKANKDLDNLSSAGKSVIAGNVLPDYTAGISISSGSTIPSNGFVIAGKFTIDDYWNVSINRPLTDNAFVLSGGGSYNQSTSGIIPVSEGNTIYATNGVILTFYPCKGES